jgi:hypothetical protein
VDDVRRAHPCVREQTGHGVNLPLPDGAQRPLRVQSLRDSIAVLDEIDPHGFCSRQTTHPIS